jgi:16S rRNA (guanine966-N2)-methyltransferase
MRIIGGALGGRRLPAKPAPGTRPTSDRVREALGSALQARDAFAGAHVLDLFAGTGALGFEALSRGAVDLVSIESDRRAVRAIRENAESLGLSDRTRALELDLLGPPDRVVTRLRAEATTPFTLVFADPPYAEIAGALSLITALHREGLLANRAKIVVEHGHRDRPERPDCFGELACYAYGDTSIALWEPIAIAAQT